MKRSFILIFLLLTTIIINNVYAEGHKWHIGIFSGATSNIEAKHTNFTLGGDLEYRLALSNNLFGIGVIGDLVFADHKESLLMGTVFIHPTHNLKIVMGNGVAISTFEIGEIEETESTHVLRLGAAYDFHISHFSISPTLNYDIIHGHGALAYGLTFGIGF